MGIRFIKITNRLRVRLDQISSVEIHSREDILVIKLMNGQSLWVKQPDFDDVQQAYDLVCKQIDTELVAGNERLI